ncbi:MAG TPA: ATP-binding cassette domain-containing protein [Propionicimonas sp.]|nr:ATP-binding cassette domain-containing protein [Propionicimonas sp.]
MAVVGDVRRAGVNHSVQAEQISVKVGRRMALDRMDVEVGAGVHGLLGRNGAGKTTLLRTLATILSPTSGSLSILGTTLPAPIRAVRDLRGRIGYAPQAPSLLPQLTAHQQVTYAGWLKGLIEADASARANEALDRVGLAGRAGDRVGGLSGGMLKRVGIASAIVTTPELVLLDEPTAGLDPEQRFAFRKLVRQLAADCTIVLSTHLVDDVAAVCDELTLIDAGRRLFSGTAAEMLATAGVAPGSEADYLTAFLTLTGAER